jgi:hypothetical protein
MHQLRRTTWRQGLGLFLTQAAQQQNAEDTLEVERKGGLNRNDPGSWPATLAMAGRWIF